MSCLPSRTIGQDIYSEEYEPFIILYSIFNLLPVLPRLVFRHIHCSSQTCSVRIHHALERGDGIALIRSDNGTSSKLLVGICRPYNLLLSVVNHRERGETIAGTKLSTPSTGDCVDATIGSGSRSLASGFSLDSKGASRNGRDVSVNGE
jgi:hypothetical protein